MSDMAMKYEDWLRGCVHHDGRKGNVYLPCDTVLAIADWIEAHRDVTPVRHGRWERELGAYFGSYPRFVYHCSMCGHAEEHAYADIKCSNYCPNCGTKMDGESDE